MPSITFHDALKATRRGIYTYPNAWKTLVLCGSVPQRSFAFAEAVNVFRASSLEVLEIRRSECRIDLERGGHIKFYDLVQFGDANSLKGREYSQIIWLFDPALVPDAEPVVRTLLRSQVVPEKALREDHCTL